MENPEAVEGDEQEEEGAGDDEDLEGLEEEDEAEEIDEEEDDEEEREDEETSAREREREEELAMKKEEDDEFERELAKMMAESAGGGGGGGGSSGGASHSHVASRPNKNMLEEGLPFIRKAARLEKRDDPGLDGATSEDDGEHMKFSLLSKKGNKHQVSYLLNRKERLPNLRL